MPTRVRIQNIKSWAHVTHFDTVFVLHWMPSMFPSGCTVDGWAREHQLCKGLWCLEAMLVAYCAVLVFARNHWRTDKCNNFNCGRCEDRRRCQWLHIGPWQRAGGHSNQTCSWGSGLCIGNCTGSEGHGNSEWPQVSEHFIFLINNTVKMCINTCCKFWSGYLSLPQKTIA